MHGYMFLFDLTKKDTMDELAFYRRLITDVKPNQPLPILIVGTKSDLSDQRQVGWLCCM